MAMVVICFKFDGENREQHRGRENERCSEPEAQKELLLWLRVGIFESFSSKTVA
jgi:hypothetical protein